MAGRRPPKQWRWDLLSICRRVGVCDGVIMCQLWANVYLKWRHLIELEPNDNEEENSNPVPHTPAY